MRTNIRLGFIGLCLVCSAKGGQSGWSLATTGLRASVSANQKSDQFNGLEGFLTFNMPWQHRWENGCLLRTDLEVTAGGLRGWGEDAFIGSVGPNLDFSKEGFPIHLRLGVSPAFLSRVSFDGMDFGIPFQFISHAGLEWVVTKHWAVAYRYQHMSNANLGNRNPGLNLHAFSICYQF